MELKFESLSDELCKQLEKDFASHTLTDGAVKDTDIIRRNSYTKDNASIWRPPFVHDIDKIMHCPYYNRYADKTQVYSLIKNDDVTRRSLHVQLVSRIARNIGRALNLNLDLIEAISLGHDMGHTPFGHTGEHFLDELYTKYAGRHFYHNIQSVRVLDNIFPYNVSLQTLDGIACHNGEIELEEYHPVPLTSFEEFDAMIERCYTDVSFAKKVLPSTLEGCVVRISDIIAYLGKDRQDAARMNLLKEEEFTNEGIGSINAEIINNLVVNIIENSYGKPYIKMDSEHFEALRSSKRDNYQMIYGRDTSRVKLAHSVRPMMEQVYGQLLDDLKAGNKNSPVFTHHIDYVNQIHYTRTVPYENTEPNQIVVDYIASMTDDYFIDLYHYLYPDSDLTVEYLGYFEPLNLLSK